MHFLRLEHIRDHAFAFLDHINVRRSQREIQMSAIIMINPDTLSSFSMLTFANQSEPSHTSHNICTYTVCKPAMLYDENKVV